MPEWPDLHVLGSRIAKAVGGHRVTKVRLGDPLVLRATKGDAVWIGAPDDGSVRVVHTAEHAPPIVTALPGLRALYEVFSRSGDAAARPATTLSVAGAEVAAARHGATATYDITAALQAALAGGNGAVPLAFASAVAGTVTVHPPHVEYRL